MKVVKSEYVTFWDVDGTLVLHESGQELEESCAVWDPVSSAYIRLRRHETMIRLLLEEKHRGAFVVVWSRGGHEWASNVIKALGLIDKVDLVMSKPLVYFDDLPIENWLKYRVFLEPDTVYKNTNQGV